MIGEGIRTPETAGYTRKNNYSRKTAATHSSDGAESGRGTEKQHGRIQPKAEEERKKLGTRNEKSWSNFHKVSDKGRRHKKLNRPVTVPNETKTR